MLKTFIKKNFPPITMLLKQMDKLDKFLRFEQLLQHLHFADGEKEDEFIKSNGARDIIYRFRPLFTRIQANFAKENSFFLLHIILRNIFYLFQVKLILNKFKIH